MRDLRTARRAPATSYTAKSPAARRRRHRRRADGPARRGPGPHRPRRRPLLRETVGRVRHAGARGQLTMRADRIPTPSLCRRMDVRLHHHPPAQKPAQSPGRALGAADVAETTYTPFQSRMPHRCGSSKPTPGSQLALFASYSYHGFITDREGEMLELEADHRRHAEIENAIRDLKYGVGLNHMPSGRFAANGAWLAVQVMAARWTARIGLGERTMTTKTLRHGSPARHAALHLPPLANPVQSRQPAASHSSPSLTPVCRPAIRPLYVPANSRQLGPSLPTASNFARHDHCGPPSSCLCGYLTPPSSPYIGIGPGPFASPTHHPLCLHQRPSLSVDSGLRPTIYFCVVALRRRAEATVQS